LSDAITIALDAMGGDYAPEIVIKGALIARGRFPNLRYLIFGDERLIQPLLNRYSGLVDISTIVHTTQVVRGEDKPSVALRNSRESSMRLAIEAVSTGKASAMVSAGNTGALMAMSKIVLRTLPGIDRPAMASYFPTMKGESVMLDLGANVQYDTANLLQFALMGSVFATAVLGIRKPIIGLLNVGSEEVKGNEIVRETHAILKNIKLPGHYHGFIEGDDIAKGTVDVIVTDGFTGNIVLKSIEGTAKLISEFLKQTFRSSFLAQIGYLFARPALNTLKVRVDPRRYNGAIFLGLNGVAVKSHGSTDAIGFANAIGVAANMVIHHAIDKIKHDYELIKDSMKPALVHPAVQS
jgi:glycerol-3-phosphate acyltransferase PlsX